MAATALGCWLSLGTTPFPAVPLHRPKQLSRPALAQHGVTNMLRAKINETLNKDRAITPKSEFGTRCTRRQGDHRMSGYIAVHF